MALRMQLESIYEKKKHWDYRKMHNKEKLLLQFLEENKWLAKMIRKLDKHDPELNVRCPIDDEIDKLNKEIKQQHTENMKALEQYPMVTVE